MAELKSITTINLYCNDLTTDTSSSECMLPLGTILAVDFNGVGSVPATRFHPCDGTNFPVGAYGALAGSATPTLTDNRFLQGAATSLNTGGSNTHTITTLEMLAHSHSTTSPVSPARAPTTGGGDSHSHTYQGMQFGIAWSDLYIGYGQNDSNIQPWSLYVGGGHADGHTNKPGSHTHTVNLTSIGSAGDGTGFDQRPAYYNVKFYIRYQ